MFCAPPLLALEALKGASFGGYRSGSVAGSRGDEMSGYRDQEVEFINEGCC